MAKRSKRSKVYIVICESNNLYDPLWTIEAIFSSKNKAIEFINDNYNNIVYKSEEDYWLWNCEDLSVPDNEYMLSPASSTIYISEYILNETKIDRAFRHYEEMKDACVLKKGNKND